MNDPAARSKEEGLFPKELEGTESGQVFTSGIVEVGMGCTPAIQEHEVCACTIKRLHVAKSAALSPVAHLGSFLFKNISLR